MTTPPSTRLALVLLWPLCWLAACTSPTPPGGGPGDTRIELQRSAGNCELTLTGEIDQNAVNRLSQSLNRLEKENCGQRWMVLNAPSGQIGAAVTMGAMLRNRNFNTRVAPGSDCLTSCVLVFAAGTGNPFFTTDSAAALRAIEISADLMLKATKVDGVYTADPKKDPTATRYEELTYDEALDRRLGVMDQTALVLCRDHKIRLKVYDMDRPKALLRIVTGDNTLGTLVRV